MKLPSFFFGQRFDEFYWVCQSVKTDILLTQQFKMYSVGEVLLPMSLPLMISGSKTLPLVLVLLVSFLDNLVVLAHADQALLS